MPLPQPKKGTAPATGKVKPSRAEQLMSMTQALASEQVPDAHTMTAIEGLPPAPTEQPHAPPAAGETARGDTGPTTPREDADASGRAARPGTAPAPSGAAAESTPVDPSDEPLVVRRLPIAGIRPSPFQPKGRPSIAAVAGVRSAIAEAGSLDALVGPEGGRIFARLDAEAARLAELAYDIAEHGVKTPLEVRRAEDGADECLAGHRRLAAAALAGHETVPAIHHGAMSSAAAAATVLRGNLHRENFTTWQEAVLVSEVQERRRVDGYRDNVRTLGTVMGWSHGKVNALLRIRRAFGPAFLDRVANGTGDAAGVEDALARAAYRDLERLAGEPDDEKRLSATRRLLGWAGVPVGSPRERGAYSHRSKRGGGFVLEVHEPVEALAAGDAATLRELLESQLARVKARLETLGRG